MTTPMMKRGNRVKVAEKIPAGLRASHDSIGNRPAFARLLDSVDSVIAQHIDDQIVVYAVFAVPRSPGEIGLRPRQDFPSLVYDGSGVSSRHAAVSQAGMGPSVFGYLAHDVLLLGYGRLSPPWVVNILEGRVRSRILTPGVSSACVPPDIAGTSARHRLAGLASGCPDIPSGGIHRDTIRNAGPGYACVICGPCLSPLSSE